MSDNEKRKVTAGQAAEILRQELGLSQGEVESLTDELLSEFARELNLEIIEEVEEQPAAVEEVSQAEEQPVVTEEETQAEEAPAAAEEEKAEETPALIEEEVQAEEARQAEEKSETAEQNLSEDNAEETVSQETVIETDACDKNINECEKGAPEAAEGAEQEEQAAIDEAAVKSEETPENETAPVAQAQQEQPEQSQPLADQPATEQPAGKQAFKLTPPENNEQLLSVMCTKRGRKLIYAPKEVVFEHTFKVLGTDKKNEEGLKVKDILDALIKAGEKAGYLEKYDGLKSSELKEEYENETVYEYAEQEFKKSGLIYDGDAVKVYLYDWDGKACHHVGFIDKAETEALIPYLSDRDNYSFALSAIIVGGKGKRFSKDENGKITVEKIKDGVVGLELDVNIMPRKD